MHLSKRVKVVAGVSALLGVVMAGGAAFTATGVSTVSQPAGSLQFVGGTVTQSVTGTVLSDINYGFADYPVDTKVDAVQLFFSDDNADGATVSATLTDLAGSVPLTCGDVGASESALTTGDAVDTAVLSTDFGGAEYITDYPTDTVKNASDGGATTSGTEDWAYCTVGTVTSDGSGDSTLVSALGVSNISVTVGNLNVG